MKKIKLLLLLFPLSFLAACVDIEEIIDLHADGTGNYSMSMDMGKLIEFANTMSEKNDSKKVKQKVDTLIHFKDLGPAFDKLTAQEKEIFKEGQCKIKLDEAGGQMKIDLSCPFKNMSDLAIVKKQLPGMMKKLQLFDKLGDKDKKGSDLSKLGGDDDDKDITSSVNPSDKQYSFTAIPGKISYAITDKEELKKMAANDSIMQMMQQASLVMGDMTTTTIIKLPAPAKTVSNPKAQLSADKKTVTLKSIITELLEKPEEGEYIVEY